MVGQRRHFEQNAEGYALHRPTYPPQLADTLAGLCTGRGHALDVGCGTGQLAVLLADRFDRVTATDVSARQIAHAASHPRVTYRVEPAEAASLPDTSVDLIVAAQAAHWFDLPAFYAEARRLASPGGVLALISYGVPQLGGPAGAQFDAFYWQDIHRFWPEGRAHVETGYRDLPFPFDEQALPALSIDRDWSLSDLRGYVETWSAVGRLRKAGCDDLFDEAWKGLARLWGDPDARYPIRWPVIGRIARLG